MKTHLPVMHALEIASGLDAIARLRPLWMEVEARVGVGAFDKFDLVLAAAKLAERQGSQALVAIVRRDQGVPSMLALRHERFLGARAAVPLLQPLAQYSDVVGAPLEANDLAKICDALRHKGTDLLLLRKVRRDGGLHAAFSPGLQSQLAQQTSHYVDIAAYGTFGAYEASFSSRTRRNRRQRLRRIEAQVGPLSFEVLRGADAAVAFDTAVRWKRDWLKRRGIYSPVFKEGAWEQLLHDAVLSGSTIVTALKAGQALIGVEVGFADRSDYIAYLGAYDETYSALSPGQEQMLRTIAWCFEQGFRRYDLLAPADDYKRHWTRTGTGVEIDDYAVALTPLGRAVTQLRRCMQPLARDLYRWLKPEVRIAGGHYGVPAAAAIAAATATALLGVID